MYMYTGVTHAKVYPHEYWIRYLSLTFWIDSVIHYKAKVTDMMVKSISMEESMLHLQTKIS